MTTTAHVIEVGADRFEAGLDGLLELLSRDRQWGDALARRTLIDAFQVIEDAALVANARRRMASILF